MIDLIRQSRLGNILQYCIIPCFSSFGTYEELKAAGEKHYTLKIRLKIPDNVQEQKEQLGEIIQVSPGAKFQERFLSRFVFDIPNPRGEVTVKSIFNFLDSRKFY